MQGRAITEVKLNHIFHLVYRSYFRSCWWFRFTDLDVRCYIDYAVRGFQIPSISRRQYLPYLALTRWGWAWDWFAQRGCQPFIRHCSRERQILLPVLRVHLDLAFEHLLLLLHRQKVPLVEETQVRVRPLWKSRRDAKQGDRYREVCWDTEARRFHGQVVLEAVSEGLGSVIQGIPDRQYASLWRASKEDWGG